MSRNPIKATRFIISRSHDDHMISKITWFQDHMISWSRGVWQMYFNPVSFSRKSIACNTSCFEIWNLFLVKYRFMNTNISINNDLIRIQWLMLHEMCTKCIRNVHEMYSKCARNIVRKLNPFLDLTIENFSNFLFPWKCIIVIFQSFKFIQNTVIKVLFLSKTQKFIFYPRPNCFCWKWFIILPSVRFWNFDYFFDEKLFQKSLIMLEILKFSNVLHNE